MASQTTSGFSFVDVKLEISTDATFSIWTDVSGFFSSIKNDGGKRKVGDTFTAAGDTPVLTKGKREAIGSKIKTVYTEGASDPFAVVYAAFQSGQKVGVRYQPKPGAGSFVFTTLGALIEECNTPQGDVEKGEPLMFEWGLKGTDWIKSASAS